MLCDDTVPRVKVEKHSFHHCVTCWRTVNNGIVNDWHHERKDIVMRLPPHMNPLPSLGFKEWIKSWSFMRPFHKVNLTWKVPKEIEKWFQMSGRQQKKEKNSWSSAKKRVSFYCHTLKPERASAEGGGRKEKLSSIPHWSRFSSRLFPWVAGWMMQKIPRRENRITHLPTLSLALSGCLKRKIKGICRNSSNANPKNSTWRVFSAWCVRHFIWNQISNQIES